MVTETIRTPSFTAPGVEVACQFCGERLADPGEAYYDHLQASPVCKSAWEEWMVQLEADHPGGD